MLIRNTVSIGALSPHPIGLILLQKHSINANIAFRRMRHTLGPFSYISNSSRRCARPLHHTRMVRLTLVVTVDDPWRLRGSTTLVLSHVSTLRRLGKQQRCAACCTFRLFQTTNNRKTQRRENTTTVNFPLQMYTHIYIYCTTFCIFAYIL